MLYINKCEQKNASKYKMTKLALNNRHRNSSVLPYKRIKNMLDIKFAFESNSWYQNGYQ